ncbi:MAG: hypothetical protein ABMA64_12275 [Myxococcota bacterium]
MIAVLVAAPASACVGEVAYDREACTCLCNPVRLFPPDGSVIPTNPVFHLEGFNERRWLRNGERMATDFPPERDTTVALTLRDIRPVEILDPGDRIELWADDVWPSVLIGHWTVGAGADNQPPRWGGAYEVRTVDTEADACGFPEHTHQVTFEGVTDDWEPGHLFVLAEGVGEYTAGKLGDQRGFDIRWDACQIDDVDLYFDFYPSYQVTLEDAAGNKAGPFEVATKRRGLGCGGRGGPTQQELEEVRPPPTDYDVGGCGTRHANTAGALVLLPLWARCRRQARDRTTEDRRMGR